MERRTSIFVATGTVTIVFAGWLVGWQAPAVGADAARSIASATLPAVVLGGGDYEYIGSSKCKKCHLSQYKTWAKTEMGQAFETLKPGRAVEIKKKHNLDPEKDYSQDPNCIECHTTGYGHAGGYATPDPSDKKAVRKAKKLMNVGCESCHGPGSAYIKVFEEIFKSKRKYKVEELYAVGLTKIEESTCTTCHNDKGPTFDSSEPFDFEKRKDEGTHDHKELKQRED